jgi:hypothetical protein
LLTGVTIPLIILRQIPVVVVMVAIGYVIGFWKISKVKNRKETDLKPDKSSDFKNFMISFSPILTTIAIAIFLGLSGFDKPLLGFDVVLAILIGLAIMITISKIKFTVFTRPFKNWGIYGITLAAYGAFLLRNIMVKAGISAVFSSFVANGSVNIILFLTVAPAVLGLLTGSPQGGVAVSVSILSGMLSLPFSVRVAALVYISAYLGYTIAPTHLCFTFTADYFKCSLGKMYKYVLPSFFVTFPIALLVYFLF